MKKSKIIILTISLFGLFTNPSLLIAGKDKPNIANNTQYFTYNIGGLNRIWVRCPFCNATHLVSTVEDRLFYDQCDNCKRYFNGSVSVIEQKVTVWK